MDPLCVKLFEVVRGFAIPLGCDPFAHEVKELSLFLLGSSRLFGLGLGLHHLFELSSLLCQANFVRSRLLGLFGG